MQIPVLRGRALATSDNESAPLVAVVNETMAKQLFPGSDALGAHFGFTAGSSREIEIVGIVRDTKNFLITETVAPTIYLPYTQQPAAAPRVSSPTFEVRTSGFDPLTLVPQVRAAIREIDSTLPIISPRSQVDEVGRRVEQSRWLAESASAFAMLTLVLASIGLFGLMSYAVTRRRREIGIRKAIGARRGDVAMMVMRETLGLAAPGVVIGAGVAIALSGYVSKLIYGLAPQDPPTIAAAALIVVLVSLCAGYLPARRAARVEPMSALRTE
jgi:hypothetical protein